MHFNLKKSYYDICSLLSTNRDSTYRDDDTKGLDEFNTNGTIAKSSSCSSFLIDILFRGIFMVLNVMQKRMVCVI